MTPRLWEVLGLIAHGTEKGVRVEPQTAEEFAACDKLFELVYVHIAPPGWAFRVNDAGRVALAQQLAATAAQPKQEVAA